MRALMIGLTCIDNVFLKKNQFGFLIKGCFKTFSGQQALLRLIPSRVISSLALENILTFSFAGTLNI